MRTGGPPVRETLSSLALLTMAEVKDWSDEADEAHVEILLPTSKACHLSRGDCEAKVELYLNLILMTVSNDDAPPTDRKNDVERRDAGARPPIMGLWAMRQGIDRLPATTSPRTRPSDALPTNGRRAPSQHRTRRLRRQHGRARPCRSPTSTLRDRSGSWRSRREAWLSLWQC